MTDKTIYISESNLEKGLYDETGAKVITNQYVRTKNKINNDVAFLRGELDFQALRNKTLTGSFDGTTGWTYNAKSCSQLEGYTTNANYKIEYYWVYSFKSDASTGQTRRFFVGSFFIRTPKIGGNKQDEPPYFSSRMCRQNSTWVDAIRGTYIADIDLGGLTISYYNSGQSGTITTMSLIEYVQPWFDQDETEYSFTIEPRGERDSEFVDTKVALLGYCRSILVYSKRWEYSNGTYLDFLQDAPIDHFHMVFEIPEVTNPAVDEIIQPNIRLETDAWYLNRDDELDNTDLPESTGDENFVSPYPASLWYLDVDNTLENKLLPESTASKFVYPYPASLWYLDDNDLILLNVLLPDELIIPPEHEGGAFYNAENLEYVKIPRTVTSIGVESFQGTNLKKVCISRNCKYYKTSFPDDCEVIFYEDMYDENYRIVVSGKHSYRYTETVTHFEDSVSEENP